MFLPSKQAKEKNLDLMIRQKRRENLFYLRTLFLQFFFCQNNIFRM